MLKRIITICLVLMFIGVSSSFAGLISEWHFDESSGSTTIVDSSGNNHNGTLTASGVSMGGNGTGWDGTGGAAYFDGSGGFINTTNGAGEYLPDQYMAYESTVSFWVNADEVHYGGVFGAYNMDVTMTYADTMYFTTYNTTHTTPLPGEQYTDWAFFTVVRYTTSTDVGYSKIYRNGIELSSMTGGYAGINSYGDLKIGVDNYLGEFKGYIDEMRVYNNAMDKTEVEALYSNYIPEPATILLLSIGGFLSIKRR